MRSFKTEYHFCEIDHFYKITLLPMCVCITLNSLPMSHWLVDEFSDENNCSDDTSHKTDSTNDDVEIGKTHHGTVAKNLK